MFPVSTALLLMDWALFSHPFETTCFDVDTFEVCGRDAARRVGRVLSAEIDQAFFVILPGGVV